MWLLIIIWIDSPVWNQITWMNEINLHEWNIFTEGKEILLGHSTAAYPLYWSWGWIIKELLLGHSTAAYPLYWSWGWIIDLVLEKHCGLFSTEGIATEGRTLNLHKCWSYLALLARKHELISPVWVLGFWRFLECIYKGYRLGPIKALRLI